MAPYLSFLHFGIADMALAQQLAQLQNSICLALAQPNPLVCATDTAQDGQNKSLFSGWRKGAFRGPSPEFPGSTVELWEIWDLPPGNKGQTASSCTRGRLGWILSQFLPGKGCKALEGVAQGSVGVSSL